jgi:hypothetical protein
MEWFLVWTRLVSVRTGVDPAGKVAETMPRASGFSSLIPAFPLWAWYLFETVLWYGVFWISAAGSQTRVVPDGFKISTRVVISNVRHPAPLSAKSSLAFDHASPADTTPADFKKSRRLISSLLYLTVPFTHFSQA